MSAFSHLSISVFLAIAIILSTALTPMSIAAVDVQPQTDGSADSSSATPDLPINDQIIDEESRAPICGPVITHSGAITSNTVWNAGYVHVLDSDVTVNAGVTLQIDSGVVVKAQRFASLYVNGSILAVGTQTVPVYFSSWHDDSLCGDTNGNGTGSVPAPDDWGWIEFGSSSNATSTIRRAIIRYSGYDPNNHGAAIRLNGVSPTLENITFSNNYQNAVELVGGNWLTNNLNMTTVVYVMNYDVTVPAANTLTIAPGVKIKANRFASLYINGKLSADGTQTAPITFTSVKDDTVCGVGAANEPVCDTNNDGTGSVPAPDDWGWIEFGSSSNATSTIRRAIVRHSGYDPNNHGAAIRLNGVSPTLENITFSNNYQNAVELVSGNWLTNNWNMPTVVYWR